MSDDDEIDGLARRRRRLMADQRLFGTAAAAKYLDMSTRKLARITKYGKIAAKRDGRMVKYDVSELDRYIDSLDDYEPGNGS